MSWQVQESALSRAPKRRALAYGPKSLAGGRAALSASPQPLDLQITSTSSALIKRQHDPSANHTILTTLLLIEQFPMTAPSSNRNSPKPSSIQTRPTHSPSTSSYLSYPVSHVVSGLYRRLTEPYFPPPDPKPTSQFPDTSNANNGVMHAPRRTASPFSPPPLTALTLRGPRTAAQILTRTLAEEIRLLLPARLQLATDWTLAYSVEQDGVSLATLYNKCAKYQNSRHGFVLVVKDSAGGVSFHHYSPPP